MTRDVRREGLRLMDEGRRILQRDATGALADGDLNLVVRRAQEAVELALKGGLRLLGTEYPRQHDVAPVFSAQARAKLGDVDEATLSQIERASLWLAQARAPSFYHELPRTGLLA